MWLECFSGSLTETLSSVRIAFQEGKLGENDGLSTKLLGFGSKRGSLLSDVVDACWVEEASFYSRWKLTFSKKP
ncbi:unnamed protein product [Prunus armeniaca]